MTVQSEAQWTSTRCQRNLRPLKAKISALRCHRAHLVMDQVDNDGDVSMDQSLVVEEHVINYTRAKHSYTRSNNKRRKVVDHDWVEEELSFMEVPTTTSWDQKRKNMDWETWGLQNEVFELLKSVLLPMGHLNKLKLSQICALEVGINVGLNSNEFSKTVEEKQAAELDQYVHDWYEGHSVSNYKRWLMFGHCIGIIFSHCDLLKEVLLCILDWSKELGLHKIMGELYLEMVSEDELWSRYNDIRVVYDGLGLKFEVMLLKYLKEKVSELGKKSLTEVYMLLVKLSDDHYDECLTVLSVLIAGNCDLLTVSPTLVETLSNMNTEQILIIEQVSLFLNIINLDSVTTNNRFLRSVYESCKSGYRSLIPILKFIRTFINSPDMKHISPSLKFTLDQKLTLRQIFKPQYPISRPFYQLFNVKNDLMLVSREPTKRSRISTGDLI